MENGYLYIATGEPFIKEALISARSLKKLNPTVHITLVADRVVDDPLFDNVIVDPFTIQNPGDGYLYKVKHIYFSSPYENTLFLDTDTYLCDDCQSLFELLDYFDLAIAPDPTDPFQARSPKTNKRLKPCLPYNTGVIAFKKNLSNEILFTNWLNIFSKKVAEKTLGGESDQTAFMEAWIESNSKAYVLAHDWNARIPFFFTLNKAVKIIHGRPKNHELIHKKLNQPLPSTHRCWLPVEEKCKTKKQGFLYNFKTFGQTIKDAILGIKR